jgi:hypothetical protein
VVQAAGIIAQRTANTATPVLLCVAAHKSYNICCCVCCFVYSVWAQVEAARSWHVCTSRAAAVCLARRPLHRHVQQVCRC